MSKDWTRRIEHVFKSQNILLSDDAIIALYNVNNILRKYYIQIHNMNLLLDNEWSLIFHVKGGSLENRWKLNSDMIGTIDKLMNQRKVPDSIWKLGDEAHEDLENLRKAGEDQSQPNHSIVR